MKMSSVVKTKSICVMILFISALILNAGADTAAKATQNSSDAKTSYSKYSQMEPKERIADAKSRRGAHYAVRIESFMKENELNIKKGGTVFIGDSITEGFPVNEVFQGKNAFNRGIGGDRIEGVAERLDICVEKIKPSRVYLMIGINDILKSNPDPIEKLAESYQTLLNDLKIAAPEADIIVFSILPLSQRFAAKNIIVNEMNPKIKEMVEKKGLKYLDLNTIFKDSKGELRKELTVEGLHLNTNGYLCWLQAMLSKEEFIEATINLSDLWIRKESASHSVDKINPTSDEFPGGRGAEQLVIYTPEHKKPSTGTNEWGSEAIVRNGVVEKISQKDSAIPKDGYVVSGHQSAGIWVETNLKPGTPVKYDATTIEVVQVPVSQMPPEYRQEYLKIQFFEKIVKIKKSGFDSQTKESSLNILLEIQKIEAGAEIPDAKKMDKITEDIKALELNK